MHAGMDGYRDGWMAGWMVGWAGWLIECMHGWLTDGLNACMHGMNG